MLKQIRSNLSDPVNMYERLRRILFCVGLLFLALPAISCSDHHEPEVVRKKLAIIVAIAEYEDRRWGKINSTNDIPIIKEALAVHGFSEENIHVVKNKDATLQGIKEAFNTTFIPKISDGDVVYFHFSGHGQQIPDDNCDEVDGFDESLVPYNAPARGSATYDGQKHLRDDDVETIINSMRLAAGPNGDVIVALDSCYSGTAARGLAPVRGGEARIGEAQQCADRVDVSKQIINADDDPSMSPFIVFSASRFNELARETEIKPGVLVGSLSYALSSAIPEATSTSTYRDLFSSVKRKMAAVVRNNPQLEGSADKEIFGGLAVTQEAAYEVSDVNGSLVRIRAGILRGVLVGSDIEFHQAQTRTPTPSTLLATGTVKFAGELNSDVQLSGVNIDSNSLRGSSAFVTNAVFGSLRIFVKVISNDTDWVNQMTLELAKNKVVELASTEQATLEIRDLRDSANSIQIVDPLDEQLVAEFQLPGDQLLSKINKSLQAYAKSRFLRKLELKTPGISGSTEILHCKSECQIDEFSGQEMCQCQSLSPVLASGESGNLLEVVVGERYKFKLRNTGLKKTYNYLLALISTGEIALLYPPLNTDGQTLSRGKSHQIDTIFRMAPPLGTDVLMLVSSMTPIDFWPVVSGQESLSKAGKDPFGLLMEDSFLGHRGPDPTFPLSSASTNLTVVRVVEAPTDHGTE